MGKIRIAQIGTSRNSHGKYVFDALKNNSDIFDIAGYALPENERREFPDESDLFKGYRELNVNEILEDPEIEAVAIETEETYLTKYAIMAAEHKKHIHMEKPGGALLTDFEKLIKTVRHNKTVFHTGYMYRYNPYIMELMESVKKGELGDIISVEAQMNCIHPKAVRQWLAKFKGGIMFFLGCHLIDLIYSIQGSPKQIIPLNKCSGIGGVSGEDFGMVVFEYEKGFSFAKVSSVEMGGFERRQLVVSGTKKTIELNPLEWYVTEDKLITGRYVRESEDWFCPTDKEISEPCDRYKYMMRSFGSMVRGEKENPWSYDYELELYRLILSACE